MLVGCVAVVAVLIAGVGWFARTTIDAARARTAADAAALAGALTGSSSDASAAAQANGGTLESFVHVGADVIVSVRVGRAVRSARATVQSASFSTLSGRDGPSG